MHQMQQCEIFHYNDNCMQLMYVVLPLYVLQYVDFPCVFQNQMLDTTRLKIINP